MKYKEAIGFLGTGPCHRVDHNVAMDAIQKKVKKLKKKIRKLKGGEKMFESQELQLALKLLLKYAGEPSDHGYVEDDWLEVIKNKIDSNEDVEL